MEDNYKATILAMATFIYHNAPEGMRQYNSENLKSTIDTAGNDWYPSSLEFQRKAGADNSDTNEVTLTIEDQLRWDTFVEGDDGNLWKKTQYHFSVCWSSFSRCSFERAQEYLNFVSEILAFAAVLNDKFSEPCSRVVLTKAEHEQQLVTAKKFSDQRAVQAAFDSDGTDAVKGMRVGTPSRLFKAKLDAAITVGSYVVQGFQKTYEVKNSIVDGNSMSLCEIKRLT